MESINKVKEKLRFVPFLGTDVIGFSLPVVTKLQDIFPAFKHKNYQLYFSGQFISLIGTWLQTVAQGWLVLQLTHSAFKVGVIAALSSLPVLFLVLFGGLIVDRFSTKWVQFVTETGAMLLAIALGLLTITGHISYGSLAVLSLLSGVVSAIDMPARQSLVVELVDKEDLPSAIAINSGTFNAARIIGPSVAGFFIVLFGIGGTFLLNAFSFLAVLVTLFMIRVKPFVPNVHPHPLKAIGEGLNFSTKHKTIRQLMILAGVAAIFGWSYVTIMPVIAEQVFHKSAAGLGFLHAATGVGSVIATIIISSRSKFSQKPLTNVIGGALLFSCAMFVFSLMTNFYLAMLTLVFVGLGLTSMFATMAAVIQNLVHDNIRGRVMSIYTLMFFGLTPFGSLQIGYIAQHFSPQLSLRLDAIVVFFFAIFSYFKLKDHLV